MSAHVLLNLSNESEKSDRIRGLSSILSLFRKKFDNTNVILYLSSDVKTIL